MSLKLLPASSLRAALLTGCCCAALTASRRPCSVVFVLGFWLLPFHPSLAVNTYPVQHVHCCCLSFAKVLYVLSLYILDCVNKEVQVSLNTTLVNVSPHFLFCSFFVNAAFQRNNPVPSLVTVSFSDVLIDVMFPSRLPLLIPELAIQLLLCECIYH